ncbi:MAG: zf-HC2 domain-containing protein [Planctomycetes bacterium]|nr:zf-HC2 domain-containing protein [Planctomycetota bacterium]
MNCKDCEEMIVDLAAGELDPAAARDVRAHLAECRSCREAFSEIEALFAAARSELSVEAPVLSSRADAGREHPPRLAGGKRRRRVPLGAVAAAVILAVVVGGSFGYWIGRYRTRPVPVPVTVIADSKPDFWRVNPALLEKIRHTGKARPKKGFWHYRARLEHRLKQTGEIPAG